MNASEFAELVDWITDRWGTADEVWANAARFASDFTDLPAEEVWAALYAKGTGPFAPKPRELVAGTVQRIRLNADPARQVRQLPAPAGAPWKQWCVDRFGEERTFEAVVRERHAEMEGMFVTDTQARLPGEDGWIEDGARPRVECRAPGCDVHQAKAAAS